MHHLDRHPTERRLALFDGDQNTIALFDKTTDALRFAAAHDFEMRPHSLTANRLESFQHDTLTDQERAWCLRELRRQPGTDAFPVGKNDKALYLRRLENGYTAILDADDDTVVVRERSLTDAVLRLVKAGHDNVRRDGETIRLLLNARLTIRQTRPKRLEQFEAWFAPMNPRAPRGDVHVLYKRDGRWCVKTEDAETPDTYTSLRDAVEALAANRTKLVRMSRHVGADVREVLNRVEPTHNGELWDWYRSITRRWRETMPVSMYEVERRGTTRTKTRL